jgi:hypothetical protein
VVDNVDLLDRTLEHAPLLEVSDDRLDAGCVQRSRLAGLTDQRAHTITTPSQRPGQVSPGEAGRSGN